ncbi:MAG TPA: class IV adenylate cyclase [Candidatus Solibacter sp.]|nr:class IV adenylate cyclase [Candidatus Solibacter sp.]
MSSGGKETEIKLAVASAKAARDLLRRVGFRLFRKRVFEANTVFDTADSSLRTGGRLLRLREAGKVATLTYKGVASVGRHKSRHEIETEIADAHAAAAIFKSLGYLPLFRYEKYRTEFHQQRGGGIAMLDETPIGVYLELEGAPRWIDATARHLGFRRADYITDSYGRLYFLWCEARGIHPTHMVFRG